VGAELIAVAFPVQLEQDVCNHNFGTKWATVSELPFRPVKNFKGLKLRCADSARFNQLLRGMATLIRFIDAFDDQRQSLLTKTVVRTGKSAREAIKIDSQKWRRDFRVRHDNETANERVVPKNSVIWWWSLKKQHGRTLT